MVYNAYGALVLHPPPTPLKSVTVSVWIKTHGHCFCTKLLVQAIRYVDILGYFFKYITYH